MFWFDGITLLLIVIVIVAAFLLGLWEGHCDADESLDYLSAEVENLNDALDALTHSYEQAVAEGDRLYDALQRTINYINKPNEGR
jgi:outer membrane murein-binding lipoprotein Lpp